MRVMLCIPTFLTDHNPHHNSREEVMIRQRYLTSFRALVSGLETEGHDVYCALQLYGWTSGGFADPNDAVARDRKEVRRADCVIACPVAHGKLSGGVHVEIGMATMLNLPLALLLERPREDHTVLVTGLPDQPDIPGELFFFHNDPSEVFGDLRAFLAPATVRI